MVLLGATTAIAYVPLGRFNVVLALLIAAAKALIVVTFFMELRRGPGLVRVFAAAGFLWLLILLGLTASDYTTRHDHPIQGPQSVE
jgi:cytochrome c oxidase subunit 4